MTKDIIGTIVEEIRNMNPYPESVFTEPTPEEWNKVNELFRNAGLIQDKFFGSQSRKVWDNCCDKIIEWLEEE